MATTYYLKGEIDSFNADEFEKELLAYQKEHGELLLDASELEYMSSSGIRALVKLSKVQGDVRIDNVNDAMFSIFYSSGLTEIFTINRSMIQLTNDNWEVAGVGASGTVYKLNNDTGIKVYKEGINFDYMNQERELARQAFISGVPTIIPNRTAKVGDQFAMLFELVDSKSLGELLTDNPDQFDELLDKYVAMLKELHAIEDTRNYFPELQDLWLKKEYMIRDNMEDKDADFIIDVYKNSLRSNHLTHGDVHTGNVLVSNGELVLVDMASMSKGPALLDIISALRLPLFLSKMGMLPGCERSMSLKAEAFDPLCNGVIARYYGVNDEATINEAKRQLTVLSALDMMFSINTIPPERVVKYYEKLGKGIMDKYIWPNAKLVEKAFAEGKLDI